MKNYYKKIILTIFLLILGTINIKGYWREYKQTISSKDYYIGIGEFDYYGAYVVSDFVIKYTNQQTVRVDYEKGYINSDGKLVTSEYTYFSDFNQFPMSFKSGYIDKREILEYDARDYNGIPYFYPNKLIRNTNRFDYHNPHLLGTAIYHGSELIGFNRKQGESGIYLYTVGKIDNLVFSDNMGHEPFVYTSPEEEPRRWKYIAMKKGTIEDARNIYSPNRTYFKGESFFVPDINIRFGEKENMGNNKVRLLGLNDFYNGLLKNNWNNAGYCTVIDDVVSKEYGTTTQKEPDKPYFEEFRGVAGIKLLTGNLTKPINEILSCEKLP